MTATLGLLEAGTVGGSVLASAVWLLLSERRANRLHRQVMVDSHQRIRDLLEAIDGLGNGAK